jgi:hypothetical protein
MAELSDADVGLGGGKELSDADVGLAGAHDFGWGQAITDIPSEIGKEASQGWENLTSKPEPGVMGAIKNLGNTASGAAQIAGSIPVGAYHSVIGHGMANAEHLAGEYVVNPALRAMGVPEERLQHPDPEKMYETAKSDVDTATLAAKPSAPRAPKIKATGVVKQPDTDEFFDAAERHYSNMRGLGVEIDPAAMNRVADNIMTELHAEGYRPRNAPKVFDAVEELRNPAGQNHEISDIDSVRKVLGKARLDHTERDAARRAIGHIDDYLADLKNNPQDVVINPHYAGRVSEEAQAARGNYAVAKRSEDIDEALDKAERQKGRAFTGGNINNAIRQQLSSLRNNKKKMAGWTDEEKAELDSVINGTKPANAMRAAGRFAPHGAVPTMMSVMAGHALLPGAGEFAAPGVGWIAKKIGDRMTKKAAANLSDVVKARSPLGKQTSINAAAQQMKIPPPPRQPMLGAGVAAALPKPHRLIMHMPQTADQGNQNPTAGFASGGGVDDDSDAGEVHPAGGVAGLAPEADSYDPFAAEKFVPEDIAQAAPQIARNLTSFQRPDTSNDTVRFKTSNPMTDISDEDIDRGMGVAMAAGAGTMKKALKEPLELAKEQGYEGPWYHGGVRMDRFTESGKINPKRATSGPMPYFTDSPEMASSYAMGKKPDTSLQDEGHVADYFTVSPKSLGLSGRHPVTVENSWHFLPPEVKQEIMAKAKRIGYENPAEASGPLTLHPDGASGVTLSDDHYDWILKHEARGNPLAALREMWHDSGEFVDDPSQLTQVYKLAGYPHAISETTAPWTEARGVFPAMIKMKNPLKTEDQELMTKEILPKLEEAFKRDRSRKQPYGADMWDKNVRYTPKEWVQQAKEDYAKGDNSYVWTSIPDKVTNELRKLGYDGIVDTGGKGGGQSHRVAIPFAPEQVRSKFAKFKPEQHGESGLMKKRGGALETAYTLKRAK